MQGGTKEHVTIEPAGHVRVELGGKTIAETAHSYVVHEQGLPDRYYVPRSDVRAKISEGSGNGVCPWKGHWKHLDVDIPGKHLTNGAWIYDQPSQLGAPLADHVAFYEDKVDRIDVS